MLYLPSQLGYDIFTSYIHQNWLTGILHGIGLPASAIGVFMIIYGLFSLVSSEPKTLTRYVSYFVLGGYTSGYLGYDPYWGILTILIYWILIHESINTAAGHSPLVNIKVGSVIFASSLFLMEFIGHWLLESQGSDVSQLFNSIFHTPLYGVKAIAQVF